MPEGKTLTFHLGNEPFSWNDLTYREKQEALRVMHDLTGDPDLAWEDAHLMFATPAMIFVAEKRRDASFTLDRALDSKESDYFKEVAPEKRPTQRKTRTA